MWEGHFGPISCIRPKDEKYHSEASCIGGSLGSVINMSNYSVLCCYYGCETTIGHFSWHYVTWLRLKSCIDRQHFGKLNAPTPGPNTVLSITRIQVNSFPNKSSSDTVITTVMSLFFVCWCFLRTHLSRCDRPLCKQSKTIVSTSEPSYSFLLRKKFTED